LHVPTEHVSEARDIIKPMAVIQVRIGELSGDRAATGGIYMKVRTKWKWIEVLKVMPGPGRKEYTDT
jgi:hypothetical protein